ncbi:MAG TPA: Hpt domain-containing protein, partial [Phenylobacterium sp.]
MDPFESIKATFFQECEELLTELESGLLAMERGAKDSETINAVFRAVHSIKGGAGAFGLEELIRFAHVFETVMDELRAGKIALTDDVAKILLRANDVLADHVQAARSGGTVEQGRSTNMLEELQSLIGAEAAAALDEALEASGEEDFGFTPVQTLVDDAAPTPGEATWTICFQPKPEMYVKANEAGLVLRELARLGRIEVSLDAEAVPPLDQMMAEHAYLRWTVTLHTAATEETIREVFEFVEDDCVLTIECVGTAAAAAPTPAAEDAFDP